VRHIRRNPQKSPAELLLDPERIVKSKKSSKKGASGSGKPKNSDLSLKNEFITEESQLEVLEPNAINKEIPSEISSTPCAVNSPLNLSAKKASHTVQNIPISLPSIALFPTAPSVSIPPHISNMVGQQAPTRIERIVAARYGPLVLHVPLNPMPVGEYKKYMPKFTGTEGVTTKEHLEAFYSYAHNLDISENDVRMRVFVQSLDGEARKWFRGLPQGSITDIEALDDAFFNQWGDKKDLLYYHTEFGNLKREKGESLPDFNKRFNKMYSEIPAKVKPTPTTAKLTYANAFDPDFCLLLRERRCATLNDMQEAALEVESNIMEAEKLKSQVDRRRLRGEASSSSASTSEPKLDKMTKMMIVIGY